MPIDVHAHYVPPRILEVLHQHGASYGISLMQSATAGCPCVNFSYGASARPFFPRLLEEESARIGAMDRIGMDRQVLALWADIFGYGLPVRERTAWHRLMNDSLGETASRHPERFSWFASGPLPDAAGAARELERCVHDGGAVGGIVAANVEGINLGELALDEYWAAAQELNVPVFIHPVQAEPLSRTGKFGLNPMVQYPFDTTLTLGSLIMSGVLDRFPRLNLIVSHGGGALPYLMGRFDCLHERMHRSEQGNVARQKPSNYLRRLYYDSIVHDGPTLRFLGSRVGVDRIVLGSDDPFPPRDDDPLASVKDAGFTDAEVALIADVTPRQLLQLQG